MGGAINTALRWINENVIDPTVIAGVTSLPREYLPTSARVFADTLAGDRTPLTEKHFSEGELDKIRELISASRTPGAVTYADYVRKAVQDRDAGKGFPTSVDPSVLSVFDDYGNVQNTLGQFRYTPTKDGYEVTDTYDFNPYSDAHMEAGNLSGLWGVLRGVAGRNIPPGTGRKVTLRLKDKK